MQRIIKENIFKNILILISLIFLFPLINKYVMNSTLIVDKSSAGDIIVAMSLIAVIGCFGNFAFTYEKMNQNKIFERYLAHITSALLMFVIGVSLIFTSLLINILMGHFILIDITLVLLYLACIGYDLWDLLKVQ